MTPNTLRRVGAALVNTDEAAYHAAIARLKATAKSEERIATLEQGLETVTSELSEIKEMLKCLLTAANS